MGERPPAGENPHLGTSADATKGSQRAPARELLLATHRFPGEYMIKAFGPALDEFRAAVRDSATCVVRERVEISERTTRGGRTVCVTLRLQVDTVDEVVSIYERLHGVENLAMIL